MNDAPNTITPTTEKRVAWQTSFDAAERKALSQKARLKIQAAISTIARDFGYTDNGDHFTKAGLFRTLNIGLQPSRYGFQCFINLSRRSSLPFKIGANDVLRLGQFYDKPETNTGELGALAYADVLDGTGHLDYACMVLKTRAFPFLNTRKARHELPKWLAQQPPLPACNQS